MGHEHLHGFYPRRVDRSAFARWFDRGVLLALGVLGLFAAAAGLIGPGRHAGLLAAAGVGAAVAVAAWRRWCRRRHGVRVDSRGVALLRGEHRELHPWEALRGVDVADAGATVYTAGGLFTISSQVVGWRALAEGLRSAVGGSEPASDVDAGRLARWLGLEPGEEVVCRYRTVVGLWKVIAVALLCGLVVFLGTAVVWQLSAPVIALGLAVFALLGGASERIRRELDTRWVADASGISQVTHHGRETFAWGDITNVRDEAAYCFVETERGEFALPKRTYSNTERVVRMLQTAYEARLAGLRLPGDDERAERGLSPARLAGEAAAERGVSRSER